MHTALKVAMASTLALATAAPAMAQYQPTPQYQQDLQRYQQEKDAYDARSAEYDAHREGYQAAREEYQHRLDAYNRARADYDARYGYGAYARYYGPAPAWDDTHWAYYAPAPYAQAAPPYDSRREGYQAARDEYQRRLDGYNRARADYDARYGYGAYARAYGPAPVWDESRWAYYAPTPYAPAAPYYGANSAYTAPQIRCESNSTVPAGVIGAIAGAVLGSNVAARNARTEGAVLGGVVGAGIGAAVGHAHDKYKCDQRGPYFSYNETIPYRESSRYRTDRYSEYQRMGCRLATAPVDSAGQDYRYVRVCPDPDGRYRIVG